MIGAAPGPFALSTPHGTPYIPVAQAFRPEDCSRCGVVAVRAKTLTPGKGELQNLAGARTVGAPKAPPEGGRHIRRFLSASQSQARTIQ